MVTRVRVNPELIKWAVNRTNETDTIAVRFPKLNEWIQERTSPTLKQLENLAKATGTPIGFFFLSAPPELHLPIPHYRTLRDGHVERPSPNLLETVQTMERRQAWMREYLIDLGKDPVSCVGSCEASIGPKVIAREMRKALNVENGWPSWYSSWEEALRALLHRIEDIGILVVRNGIVGNNSHRKLDVSEFRGFVLVDEYAPLIFINGADGKAAQMFTVAHELAHLWIGASAAFDLSALQPADQDIERICNQIAAEFLLAEDELSALWSTVRNRQDKFRTLARHFKVSSLVVARRALDLRLISRDEFFDFYNTLEKSRVTKFEDSEGGGNFYTNQNYRVGRRFAQVVFTSVKEGSLDYQEAYRLTGLKGNSFSKYAEYLGMEVYS